MWSCCSRTKNSLFPPRSAFRTKLQSFRVAPETICQPLPACRAGLSFRPQPTLSSHSDLLVVWETHSLPLVSAPSDCCLFLEEHRSERAEGVSEKSQYMGASSHYCYKERDSIHWSLLRSLQKSSHILYSKDKELQAFIHQVPSSVD